MSTDSLSTKHTGLSVKALVEKKRKTHLAEVEANKKKKVCSATPTKPKGEKAKNVVIEVPEDFGNATFSQWSHLYKFYLPKMKEERRCLKPTEVADSLSQNAFKLFQDCLGAAENIIKYKATLESTCKKFEKAKKENSEAVKEKEEMAKRIAELEAEIVSMDRKNNELKVEVADIKTDLAKAQAEKAQQEREVAKVKLVLEDTATYYGWKARIEMMEEHAAGKSSTWDAEAEKEEFEGFYEDGAPDAQLKLTQEIEEVQSMERAAPLEGTWDNSDKGVEHVAVEIVAAAEDDGKGDDNACLGNSFRELGVLAEKETALEAKEQDLLDRVQEQKDTGMAAITEAKEILIPECLNFSSTVNVNGDQVSSSVDAHASLDTQDEKSPLMGETNEGAEAKVVIPRAVLNQLCEQMDSIGLVKFLSVNMKNLTLDCKEQLSVALGSAAEPARLVLNALDEGFFPAKEMTHEGDNSNAALCGMRKSCLILMEAMSAFMSEADLARDYHIQQVAKSIANNWKHKLSKDSGNAANENSLEVEGFLRLLATFRIASEFDEEQLCKYVLAVDHYSQAIDLCHSLDLTQKIPGLVKTLIESERQIDAVHFIHAFELSQTFPPVPLLKNYLREVRRKRSTQGNGGSAALKILHNAQELKAVRDVIECIESYKLEDSYPLGPLRERVYQLDKSSRPSDWKKHVDSQREQQKKQPSNGEFQGTRRRGVGRGRNFSPPPRPVQVIPAVPNPQAIPFLLHNLHMQGRPW